MDFSEQLDAAIRSLACTGKELAQASGLSEAVISRCRSGSRLHAPEGETAEKLARGLARLAAQKKQSSPALDAALKALRNPGGEAIDPGKAAEKLNALLALLGIRTNELARALNYDASYLSRIRSGQRRPANWQAFAQEVGRFAARRCAAQPERGMVAGLLGCDAAELAEQSGCAAALSAWLCQGALPQSGDSVTSFLKKLDDFDLNQFTRAVHYDEIHIPTALFQAPLSKAYFGLEGMRQGELAFMKATVLSRHTEPVTMYNDMPVNDLSADGEFLKKWVMGAGLMLKKGLRLNMVHNVERPFDEMMLGLENWIPLYMTGQVSPWYLRGVQNNVFGHLCYCSGAAAMSGECISGFHEEGRYLLTNNSAELAYAGARAKRLLEHALPLMDIYRAEQAAAYRALLEKSAQESGERRHILSAPPLYTMPAPALDAFLAARAIPAKDQAQLREYAAWQRALTERFLLSGTICDEICQLTREEFSASPVSLSLAGTFYETDIPYTWEEYCRHLEATRTFMQSHTGYSFRFSQGQPLRNIQIFAHIGSYALVSKSRSPSIHFVIRNPRLRRAIENMVLPQRATAQ